MIDAPFAIFGLTFGASAWLAGSSSQDCIRRLPARTSIGTRWKHLVISLQDSLYLVRPNSFTVKVRQREHSISIAHAVGQVCTCSNDTCYVQNARNVLMTRMVRWEWTCV